LTCLGQRRFMFRFAVQSRAGHWKRYGAKRRRESEKKLRVLTDVRGIWHTFLTEVFGITAGDEA
jgi:hypothetical protein